MSSTDKHFFEHWYATLAIAVCCLAGCTPATNENTVKPPLSMGAWITYWDFERGSSALEQSQNVFDDVFFFSWALDSSGNPILINRNSNEMRKTLASLKQARIRSWLTIVNDVHYSNGRFALKHAETINRLLMDDDKRAQHRAKLLEQAQLYGFGGIDIDYENLHFETRKPFNRFIRELATDVKQNNLKLSVTVQPKRGSTRSTGPGAMDWSILCQYVDRFQIMLYNLHNKHTAPGSMASADWIREVMGYAQKKCDREKIVAVLKVSGMQWGPSGTTGIQFLKASNLLHQHDTDLQRQPLSEGGAPYFTYRDMQGTHTVYYEDTTSLLEKIRLLRSMGFGKIVLWSLGKHDPHLLDHLLLASG